MTWIPFAIESSQSEWTLEWTFQWKRRLIIYSPLLCAFLRESRLDPYKQHCAGLILQYDSIRSRADELIQDPNSNEIQVAEVQLLITAFLRDHATHIDNEALQIISRFSKRLKKDIEALRMEETLQTIEEDFFEQANDLYGVGERLETMTFERRDKIEEHISVAVHSSNHQALKSLLLHLSQPITEHCLSVITSLGNREALHMVLEHNKSHGVQHSIIQLLRLSVEVGNSTVVEYLLELGADPDNLPECSLDIDPNFPAWAQAILKRPKPLLIEIAILLQYFDVARLLLRYAATVSEDMKQWIWRIAETTGIKGHVTPFLKQWSDDDQDNAWRALLLAIPLERWHETSPYRNISTNYVALTEDPQSRKEAEDTKSMEDCQIIAAIHAREAKRKAVARKSALSRIHNILLSNHLDFVMEVAKSSASSAMRQFAQSMGTYRAVFKRGMSTIRKFLNNIVPETLSELFSCLEVADAMRLSNCNSKGHFSGNGDNVPESCVSREE